MTKPIALPLPSDVDLATLDYMPFYDRMLDGSRAWLKARNWRGGGPGLGFALLNLWRAAFRSAPAGSLQDDNDMLAYLAGVSIEVWAEIKELALDGWERHDGRLWHPVVAEITWGLWLDRLKARHTKAGDTWRHQARRATDKGREPPDKPAERFETWLEVAYPSTFSYLSTISDASGGQNEKRTGHPAESQNSPTDNFPKRSEAKGISPLLSPQALNGRGRMAGKEGGEGKVWFRSELARLQTEFGTLAPMMMACLQRPNVSSKYTFVETLRGARAHVSADRSIEIVMPTKARADALMAEHGEWIRLALPNVRVRFATTAEKRAWKGSL